MSNHSVANIAPGDPAFSEESFGLLKELLQDPKKARYLEMKDAFQAHVIAPFRAFFKTAVEKLPDSMTAGIETEKNVFSQIIKNDYGRGGVWPHYWGALYPKNGKRITDAQLFIYMFSHAIRFGFYVGEHGSGQRNDFLTRCQMYRSELKKLLGHHFSDSGLFFGNRENSDQPEKIAFYEESRINFEQWLENPGEAGIHVSVQLPASEVTGKSIDELANLVAHTWETVFPLYLVATEDYPIPAIQKYLGMELPSYSQNTAYPLTECSRDTGLDEETLQQWITAIKRKKQAVLYGPPGTGKTYVARRLANHLIGDGDGFVQLVQFHPAYTYEDFIQGIRPRTTKGGLEYSLEPGRFLTFCQQANERNDLCVLIIDEINRAHLSRVFGELMYLLEYRDEGIPLAGGTILKIPRNVLILGTMNTADRSIALVDHALRRRFAFIGLYPNYQVLEHFHAGTDFNATGLIGELKNLNNQIGDKHYQVGISFFLVPDIRDHLADIWKMEIEPYLEEYFFDKMDTVDAFRWEKIKDRIKL